MHTVQQAERDRCRAIKADLKLTTAQVGNSNIVALLATLVVRFAVGPAVDRWGREWPRAALCSAGSADRGPSQLAR